MNIRELLDYLDGNGLVITDYDLIMDTLDDYNLTLDDSNLEIPEEQTSVQNSDNYVLSDWDFDYEDDYDIWDEDELENEIICSRCGWLDGEHDENCPLFEK